ncbi:MULTISPECIES: Crp/Fnr family transcriptional regulator [Ulvibacterium]|uniref:Crp/Fnr family transcriptional regulator n=1 Tax=Ulvibacterium marinum TaxID=2419782 RepID=A0A3B0CB67_9FLAO|nr:Crp/Fnr family transcriptional regulator [Ulvibacterium marinum]RKN83232.1 Crp/Fnr family transcriptional regulator [Ulvibacterium marinum]
MKNPFLQEIFDPTIFSSEELKILGPKFKKITLKKGDVLLRSGEKVSYTHYVHIGCLRCYFIDEFGKDHTLQFAIKDWWISDYTAFFSGTKAMMNIECIKDTTLYRLSRKNMEQLYLDIPAFETFFRKKLEKRMEAFHRRTLNNLAFPAKDRYLSFVKTYPRIEQQVKNYHIASYLGITTESLSRIRKEIAQ